MTKNLLELIDKYGQFNNETGLEDLSAFSVWLNRALSAKQRRETESPETQIQRDIAYMLNRLAKFSRFYTRKALSAYGMISIDEFYFLLSIAKLGSPTKNEVYKDTITELTTGAQIMRRLVQNGLVKEAPDRTDKRMKRVCLTAKGRTLKDKIFKQFGATVKLKTANLSNEERKSLLGLLSGLNDFHERMYAADSEKTIDYLTKKYLIR